MSFNTCSLFLLFLVCISLNASNARRLAVFKNPLDDNLRVSIQNDEEKRVSISEAKMESSSKMGETDKVLKGTKMEDKKWRVPHNKPEENHPGFNLDYSPPKTHPPSHN